MKQHGGALRKFISLVLSVVLAVGILPLESLALSVTPNSGDYVRSKGGGGDGKWNKTMQGFRISVIDHAGEPAFKFNGTWDALDLTVASIPTDYDFYGIGIKTSGIRGIADSKSEYNQYVLNMTIDGFANQFGEGEDKWHVAIKEGGNYEQILSNFRKLASNPPMLWSDAPYGHNPEITALILGGEGKNGVTAELRGNAALRLIFNCYGSDDTYLWKLNPSACIRDEQGRAIDVKDADKKDPLTLCGKYGLRVSVEPIIWNVLRTSGSGWTNTAYGTQTDIAWMIENKYTGLKYKDYENSCAKFGGYDISLFGRVGRKSMNLGNDVTFNYKKVNGTIQNTQWMVKAPVGGKATSTENAYRITNQEMLDYGNGYSLY